MALFGFLVLSDNISGIFVFFTNIRHGPRLREQVQCDKIIADLAVPQTVRSEFVLELVLVTRCWVRRAVLLHKVVHRHVFLAFDTVPRLLGRHFLACLLHSTSPFSGDKFSDTTPQVCIYIYCFFAKQATRALRSEKNAIKLPPSRLYHTPPPCIFRCIIKIYTIPLLWESTQTQINLNNLFMF